jgi:hypothetical protein
MTESRLFLSSCSRRELARRRPGRGHALAVVRAWSTSTPPLALALIVGLAVVTVALTVARGLV